MKCSKIIDKKPKILNLKILNLNICLSKWIQISSQYLANNAFVSVQNKIFTPLSQISSQESGTYQRNSIYSFNFFFESFKHNFIVFIFPYLIYNTVQMSQVDSVCTEKTCLSHMDMPSAYIEQLDTHEVSSFTSCYVKLKFCFWLRLKLQVKTLGLKISSPIMFSLHFLDLHFHCYYAIQTYIHFIANNFDSTDDNW